MSAFICSDEHIATIAHNYAALLGHHEKTQAIADALLAINIASVNHRYNETTVITPCDIGLVRANLRFEDLVALCNCLDYQSCELPDYQNPLLDAITAQFKANCAVPGIESDLWDI